MYDNYQVQNSNYFHFLKKKNFFRPLSTHLKILVVRVKNNLLRRYILKKYFTIHFSFVFLFYLFVSKTLKKYYDWFSKKNSFLKVVCASNFIKTTKSSLIQILFIECAFFMIIMLFVFSFLMCLYFKAIMKEWKSQNFKILIGFLCRSNYLFESR